LGGGTLVGNLVQGVVGIVLARILQPELFGIYALALSLGSVMVIFLGLGAYEAVTTILGEAYAKRDRQEIRDSLAFLVKLTIITAVIGLAGSLLAPQIAIWLYGNAQVGIFAAVIVVALIIAQTIFPISRMLFQIIGRIKAMTILGITDQISRFGISLIFVAFGFSVLGAVSGHLVGAMIVLIVAVLSWRNISQKYEIIPSLRKVLGLWKKVKMKKYLGFSIWIALDRNIAILYLMLPVLLVGIYVAAAEVAFFKLAFGYINLAISFLGPISILLNVKFPKMKVTDAINLRGHFIRVSLYSLGISALLTLGAVIVAPIFFRVVYGETFISSVPLVFSLFIYGALMGIGVGLGPMWRAIRKVKTSIIINLITLGTGIPLGLYLIKNFGLQGAVIMVTVWFTVSHFVSFFYLTRELKKFRP